MMAADHETSPPTDDDPATASDALSLHTIAEQADAYEAQEQEDADFALALQLEEEETQRLIQSRRQPQRQTESQPETQSEQQAEALPPYCDDPEAESNPQDNIANLPPYRDDPNAAPTDEEAYTEAAIDSTRAKRVRGCLRVLRKLIKTYFCLLGICTVLTIVIIGIVLGVILVFGKHDPKDAAWKVSHSNDGDLKLPKLYPALEEGATEECKKGWEKYAASISCHRMILSPAWDNGNADEVKAAEADPYGYSEQICTDQCRRSIRYFDTPMNNLCYRRTDRFNLSSYGRDGKAYFDKDKIPEGPIHVQKELIDRWERFCARPPRRQKQSEWGTCAADLWMRWGVVDGKNRENLNGLDKFLEKTDEKRTDDGGWKSGMVNIVGGRKSYQVYVPTRKVGPGIGETDCGYCTLEWLERKLRSFEYGQMINDTSGKMLGLVEFRDLMGNAIGRCGKQERDGALARAYMKWTEYGWWWGGKPTHKDPKITDEVRKILHGMWDGDFPFSEIRKQMKKSGGALKKGLGALHDGMASMPCSIWFHQQDAIEDIIPHQHIIDHLCSDRCRNAVDRIQQQHGEEFAALAGDESPANIFKAWEIARENQEKICKNNHPKGVVNPRTAFCAPGYAAIGHPEWIFTDKRPSKPEILAAFTPAIDKLAANLEEYHPKPKDNPESQSIFARRVVESVCNPCTGELFIGKSPDYKKTIMEFQDDPSIDGRNYTKVAKKGWVTCAKQLGVELSWWQKQNLWKEFGLDRYD